MRTGQWNPRYVAYARAHHVDVPAEMLRRDQVAWPGGCMTGFILWLNERWREWDKLVGIRDPYQRELELHDAHEWFDLWLQVRSQHGSVGDQ